ncbi:hypothetical protein NO2_1683, partial [Candidatus Termititenax persephonae]
MPILLNTIVEKLIVQAATRTIETAGDEVGLTDYPFRTLQKALTYLTSKGIANATVNIAEAVYPLS